MVEIIRKGQLRSERIHEVTCRHCDSELRFKENEAKVTHCQRDGDFMTITCPVCKAPVTKGWTP